MPTLSADGRNSEQRCIPASLQLFEQASAPIDGPDA
jgi:hypothetical protein